MIRGMQKIDLAYVQVASSEVARDINRDVILEVVRAHQPISRAELSRLSGLQRSTVSLIIHQLIQERWIREGAVMRLPRGRRPTMVMLNDQLAILVADIRPKTATVAAVDLNGCVLSRMQLPVTADPKKTLAAIVQAMLRIRKNHPQRSFEGVGVSLEGRVHAESRRLRFAPNLGWLEFDIRGTIEKGMGLPVELDNAANACLLAETWFGRMDGVRDAVLVTIFEGVGAGILANGRLVYGDDGMAGEYGHLPVDPAGPVCGCGARGCWETVSSSDAALRYYAEGKPKRAVQTIEDLLALVEEGDGLAIAAMTKQAKAIGRGLRLISATLAPQVILLAGDITAAWERFAPVIEEAFRAASLAGLVPRLMPTHEAEVARLRGAAILVLQRRSRERRRPGIKAQPAPSKRRKAAQVDV